MDESAVAAPRVVRDDRIRRLRRRELAATLHYASSWRSPDGNDYSPGSI